MSPARAACIGACVAALGGAGCDQSMLIGTTDLLHTAIEGTDGATGDASGAVFVSFTLVTASRACSADASCTNAWTLDATGMLTCPNGAEAQVTQADLDAFVTLATSPDTVAALADPSPCDDASPGGTTEAMTVWLGGRPLTKDTTSCQADPYDQLRYELSALNARYCGDAG